jgi:hypothetical protein
MGVISIPPGLRLATMLYLLCVPLAALETVIAARAPWWRLPYDRITLWSTAVALLCLPQAAWLARGRPWALKLSAAFSLLWCTLSGWFALRTENSNLGFFTLGLTLFLGGILIWIRRELSRSYFDPAMAWYQGLPMPIPGLTCELVHGDITEEFSVSRVDRDGAFLFHRNILGPTGETSLEGPTWMDAYVELRFRFRDRDVRCTATPVRALEREQGMGAGFRFANPSADTRKEIGDFVEHLRGEGYVS